MAHLWIEQTTTGAGGEPEPGWWALPLDGESPVAAPAPWRPLAGGGFAGESHVLLPCRSAESGWVLISGAAAVVNGFGLGSGMRVLRDRDELRLALPGGAAAFAYFSSQRLARVEPFPGADRTLFCPRCKRGIEPGTAAVSCPQCAVWHHQSEPSGCWEYSEHCTLCPQPTDLGATYRWSPEEL